MKVVHMGDCPIAWDTSIRWGSQVHSSFLEEFPTSHGDTVDDEHYLSSQTDHPDSRGHASGMRSRSQG